ncbi:DJ-1/PfpI family protein [Rosistilla oblonga]|uniref:DJ-1/PfpI family protein n=1 Tax=Rosistilla oblonga TaxID=2527990 RepID=UPI0018D2086B|nr:DJ-1/PfpI family protein [Rosistilla oblonga]
MSRRRAMLAAAGLATAITGCKPAEQSTDKAEIRYAKNEILMLVYPRFTTLDLIGPQHVFALLGPEFKTRLVWKDRSVVTSDTGVPVTPTMTFDQCQDNPAILFVPGGTDGTLEAMEDPVVRDFLATKGATAKYVTSVCTGSMLLGAAGLLDGYRATCHWLALDTLRQFGAQPIRERVVVDRNRVTGAGVTAGIDFALTLTSLLKDDEYAKTVQLMMEYDPQPPFDSGTPETASPEAVELLQAMSDPFLRNVEDAIARIKN